MRFVSIGECMVELAPGETPGHIIQGFAGDTFNTLWYLKRLRPDIVCCYLTGVGSDPLSDQFVDMMTAEGIDISGVHRSDDQTMGLYMISLQDGERSFSYWRSQSAARGLANSLTRLRSVLEGADMVYLSGITLAIVPEPARLRLFQAIGEARARGARLVFDPNLRPTLWESASVMRSWVSKLAGVSDIVLPSFEDEAQYFGDATPAQTLERYGTSDVIVVKNGAEEILWQAGGSRGCFAPAQSLKPVDTTAAGDSFNAGFLSGLDQGFAMDACLGLASRLAGHVISHRGALVQLTAADLAQSAA